MLELRVFVMSLCDLLVDTPTGGVECCFRQCYLETPLSARCEVLRSRKLVPGLGRFSLPVVLGLLLVHAESRYRIIAGLPRAHRIIFLEPFIILQRTRYTVLDEVTIYCDEIFQGDSSHSYISY